MCGCCCGEKYRKKVKTVGKAYRKDKDTGGPSLLSMQQGSWMEFVTGWRSCMESVWGALQEC